jgi:CheY-like chemotaxis protein
MFEGHDEGDKDEAQPELGDDMRLLVVEDDRRIAARLKKGLAEDSHVVDVVHDGGEGLAMAEAEIYDVIILESEMAGTRLRHRCTPTGRRDSDPCADAHGPVYFG